MRKVWLVVGIVMIAIAALLAIRDDGAPRSSPSAYRLTPPVSPTPPQSTATAGPPLLSSSLIPPLQMGTVTPVASLTRAGRLLFGCNSSLCLMNADGTQLQQLLLPAPQGEYLTPRWSPDGQVFVAQYLPQVSGLKFTGEVKLFSADGALLASFSAGTTSLLGWLSLAWSPNGKWLALATVRDENGNGLSDPGEPSEIRILDRQTWREAFAPLLVGSLAVDVPLAWSPNSRWLALTVSYPAATPNAIRSDGRELLLFDAQSDQMRHVEGTDPTWGMDSNHLAFVSTDGQELRTLDVTTNRVQTFLTISDIRSFLAHDDPWLPSGRLDLAWPTWSPDGAAIAFRVWGTADEPWPKYFPGMIFVWNLDTRDLQRLPDTDTPNTGLQIWTPSGDRLAYPYWLVGNGRYDPHATMLSPEKRFTYKDCCSGLIIYGRQDGIRDEPGVLPFPNDQLSGWSSGGKWFAAPVSAPDPETVLIFSVQDPRHRWMIPGLTTDHIEWQPLR